DFHVLEIRNFELGERTSAALRDYARCIRTLISFVGFAIYVAAVSRLCGQDDFVITTTVNGRDRPEFAETTGYLGHPMYLRMRLGGREDRSALVERVSQEYTRALFNRDFGETVIKRIDLMGRTMVQWY